MNFATGMYIQHPTHDNNRDHPFKLIVVVLLLQYVPGYIHRPLTDERNNKVQSIFLVKPCPPLENRGICNTFLHHQARTQARKQATRQTEQQHENRALASDRLSQYLLVVEVSSPLYNEAAAIST